MSFASDASLFVHQLDIANDRLLLMRVSEADLRSASFLDQRLIQPEPGQQQRAMQWGDSMLTRNPSPKASISTSASVPQAIAAIVSTARLPCASRNCCASLPT